MPTTDDDAGSPDVDEFAAASGGTRSERRRLLGKIAELLERNGIDVDDIGRIQKLNVWQGFHKDDEGETHIVDLAGITLSPKWAEGPEWPVAQPAAPTIIKPRPHKATKHEGRVTVVLPDPQVGFRRYLDGEVATLDPMHDPAAIEVALKLIDAIGPDGIINLGDFLDLAEWTSKFVVLPEFVLTTQPSLDAGHRFLADQRVAAGEACDIKLLGGNHDDRLALSIVRNAMAALRLRQANAPESWPVLSLPNLLRLDDLGVEYVGAYPAGRLVVAGAHGRQAPLIALHGERLDMKKQAQSERVSTVQGHAHHFATHVETYDGGPGVPPLEVEAHSLGCLCRLDGAVPSKKGGTDDRGAPFVRWESWQQGIGVVIETDDGWWLEPIRIRDGVALWKGKVFRA